MLIFDILIGLFVVGLAIHIGMTLWRAFKEGR